MTLDCQPRSRGPRGEGLVLVGYRGTGKSTVGKILADRLHRRFLDADGEIETRAGQPITSIFAIEGEPAFRDWEERTIRELVQAHPSAVIATGGGAVIRECNRMLLLSFGLVVWLKADPQELARRLLADPRASARPPLTPAGVLEEIASVMEARKALYHEIADVEVDTFDRSPQEVAQEILDLFAP